MLGFIMNRRKTLVLALITALCLFPMLPGVPAALPIDTGSGPGKGSGPNPGDGQGDPDVPTAPARTAQPGAQWTAPSPARYAAAQPVGDGRALIGEWMWRLRIVLRGLGAYTFRF